MQTDRVSAPMLTWRLPLDRRTALGRLSTAANNAAVPLHMNGLAMDLHPLMFATDDPVLPVKNPRLVEAAAERALPFCVIATNGNSASAVMRPVDALLDAHIPVCHHGDFDGAGIAIWRRLHAQGCAPWRMGWNDYVEALDVAADLGLELPVDA